MSKKKNERLGEVRYNHQGLRMKIVQYNGNKDVTIKFLETGEERHVSYLRFRKGRITANLLDHPVGNECTFTQAKWITVALIGLAAVTIAGLIYFAL